MKQVKRSDLTALIRRLCYKGARPITVVLNTTKVLSPRQREELGMTHVTKRSKLSAFLNFNYENAVNRQRVREKKKPNFKSKGVWFKHKDGEPVPVVHHKLDEKKTYLQLKVERVLKENYISPNQLFMETDYVKGILHPKKPARGNSRQNLSREVITICPRFEAIEKISCDNEEFLIVD